MRNPFILRKASIDRLFLIHGFNLSHLMLIEKHEIARWLFYLGMLLVIYGSLDPWFLWRIYRYYTLFAFVPIVISLLWSRNLKRPLFDRKDWLYPTVSCALLILVMTLASGKNINGVFMVFFSTVVYYSLFRLNHDELQRLGDFLSTCMASLMAISIPFYLAYLIGVPLPHFHVAPEGMDYSYENYYFFMVDDRFYMELIPRFHSVFIEPAHLGMACVTLLYCQIGKWNTWRCKILFLTIAMTFSLAAYICMVLMLFSSTWMKGKAIIGKIIALCVIFAFIVIGSIFYNKGDNLVNTLIVQRLALNSDGEIEGDNRTTDVFTKEYEKMIRQGEWMTGKGLEDFQRYGFGNSGFRVFLYCYGGISVLFLILFLGCYLHTSDNPRAIWCVLLITFASFIAHGIPIKYYFFVPLYIFAFSRVRPKKKESEITPAHGTC